MRNIAPDKRGENRFSGDVITPLYGPQRAVHANRYQATPSQTISDVLVGITSFYPTPLSVRVLK